MPTTRNDRAQAPMARSRYRSPNVSTASIPSDDSGSGDEGAHADLGRGHIASILAEYQRSYQAAGDVSENIGDEEDNGDERDDDPTDPSQSQASLPPRGLKEISSLASWTVSTSKPGCGVAALRSPDTSLFWQSDGPQPHLLSIHFFKLVSISHMRIFLDFDNDESYTPTKMQFLAGMGVHDLQEFCEMTFEQPRGWIDVDFSQVGPVDDDEEDETGEEPVIDWESRPVLRCFLVQVRIMENHQNGKDTHLRGLQIFAKDERADEVRERRESVDVGREKMLRIPERPKMTRKRSDAPKLKKASWMLEPELR